MGIIKSDSMRTKEEREQRAGGREAKRMERRNEGKKERRKEGTEGTE